MLLAICLSAGVTGAESPRKWADHSLISERISGVRSPSASKVDVGRLFTSVPFPATLPPLWHHVSLLAPLATCGAPAKRFQARRSAPPLPSLPRAKTVSDNPSERVFR